MASRLLRPVLIRDRAEASSFFVERSGCRFGSDRTGTVAVASSPPVAGEAVSATQRVELLSSGIEMCSGVAGVFEQFDSTFEVVSSFFDAALIAIEASESELGDCEARLGGEGFLVVGQGQVGMSERLVGGSEGKVELVGLVGERFEFD